MTTLTDDTIEADLAALNAHTADIGEPHHAAFAGPVVSDYQAGAIVWLWDYHSTGVVQGRAPSGAWFVTTPDVDGVTTQYEYPSGHLRPATEPHVFRWPSIK